MDSPQAGAILDRRDLCGYCAGRLSGVRRPAREGAGECHVCRGIFGRMDGILGAMLRAASGYSYETFAVGATMKPSVLDRDDNMRSAYRLTGTIGIKTHLIREASRRFAKRTGASQDNHHPDITLTLNLKEMSCDVRSRAVSISGRYTKGARGIPQKQEPCGNCNGTGCKACGLHGIVGEQSVQGIISRIIFEDVGGTTARFTWIGGEDKSSTVSGAGRPFFARVQNPSRRILRRKTARSGAITVTGLRVVDGPPKKPLPFRSLIRIRIRADEEVGADALRALKRIPKAPVIVYDASGRRAEKTVYSLRYRRMPAGSLLVTMSADGGLPVKRFVAGDDVSPSVSQLLGVPCECLTFDFLDVSAG